MEETWLRQGIKASRTRSQPGMLTKVRKLFVARAYAICGKPEKGVIESPLCVEIGLPNYRLFTDPSLSPYKLIQTSRLFNPHSYAGSRPPGGREDQGVTWRSSSGLGARELK